MISVFPTDQQERMAMATSSNSHSCPETSSRFPRQASESRQAFRALACDPTSRYGKQHLGRRSEVLFVPCACSVASGQMLPPLNRNVGVATGQPMENRWTSGLKNNGAQDQASLILITNSGGANFRISCTHCKQFVGSHCDCPERFYGVSYDLVFW